MHSPVDGGPGRFDDAGYAERLVRMLRQPLVAEAMGQGDRVADPGIESGHDLAADHGFKDPGRRLPVAELERQSLAVAETRRNSRPTCRAPQGRGANHRATTESPRPRRDAWPARQSSSSDVIGRQADMEDRVKHQLHAAGSRADDQIDAGQRLREALACTQTEQRRVDSPDKAR